MVSVRVGIALMWRGGCIIRSVFLGNIKEAYDKDVELENLLLDDFFKVSCNCKFKCYFMIRRALFSSVYRAIWMLMK